MEKEARRVFMPPTEGTLWDRVYGDAMDRTLSPRPPIVGYGLPTTLRPLVWHESVVNASFTSGVEVDDWWCRWRSIGQQVVPWSVVALIGHFSWWRRDLYVLVAIGDDGEEAEWVEEEVHMMCVKKAVCILREREGLEAFFTCFRRCLCLIILYPIRNIAILLFSKIDN